MEEWRRLYHWKNRWTCRKNKEGYILAVDVEHPRELHENYTKLPFLTEIMKLGIVEKLVPNLKDKKRYLVHIKALDQALKRGLKLKKVHRVIEFQQSKWVKAYIMLNTRLRKDAKNEFENDFFKLMNSVFGNRVENIRNHKDIKLVTSDKKYLKYVMKLNFKDGHPFSKHLFVVEKKLCAAHSFTICWRLCGCFWEYFMFLKERAAASERYQRNTASEIY